VLCLALAAAFFLPSCNPFHQVGPEDPTPVVLPAVVDVAVEYWPVQPCRTAIQCGDPVVFYGSWMRPGGQFDLQLVAATGVWRGVANGVPVNFPPVAAAYEVHVYDPRLKSHGSKGATAITLIVGGEQLRQLADEGTPRARGGVYIDANGQGHNPF
jgi:hypothetical protein